MDLIDLHTHTTASDGSLTPAQVVQAAAQAGLKAVAITDHDTVAGLDQALAASRGGEIEVVPGVEISVERRGSRAGMHILGLYLDHRHPGLLSALERLQEARARRNPQIAQRLRELGLAVSMEQVEALAGGGQVGRPHFAQVLVQMGAVADRGEAFARYLAADAPAYVPKFRFPPDEAIAFLRRAGAVPILAHPGLLRLRPRALEELLGRLKEQGLEGVEAYYSEHDPATERLLASLAARLGLVVSGGSDFHGANKPDIALGRGLGGLRVPATLLAGIRQRHRRLAGE